MSTDDDNTAFAPPPADGDIDSIPHGDIEPSGSMSPSGMLFSLGRNSLSVMPASASAGIEEMQRVGQGIMNSALLEQVRGLVQTSVFKQQGPKEMMLPNSDGRVQLQMDNLHRVAACYCVIPEARYRRSFAVASVALILFQIVVLLAITYRTVGLLGVIDGECMNSGDCRSQYACATPENRLDWGLDSGEHQCLHCEAIANHLIRKYEASFVEDERRLNRLEGLSGRLLFHSVIGYRLLDTKLLQTSVAPSTILLASAATIHLRDIL